MTPEISDTYQKKQMAASPRELVMKYIRYLPWIVISVALMLMLAYLKLRYSTPIYTVSGKLLVARNNNRNSGDKFEDIFMMQQGSSNNLNNEMEILRSRFMASRVVKALDLQVLYLNKGKIRTTAIHAKDMPFQLELISLKDSAAGFSVMTTLVNDNQFRIAEGTELYNLNQPVVLPQGSFRLVKKETHADGFASNQFIVSWMPMEQVAASLSSSIKVEKVGDFSDVLGLSYSTDNTRLGLDIVNNFMLEYQKFGLEDKKQQSDNTLSFINEQLASVKSELGGVEKDLQGIREQNRVFAPEQQSILYFGELSESNKQITEQSVRLKVVEYLIKYITDKKNIYRLVPSTLGIEEPSLLQQISEFNKLQLERETALKTTTEANPMVVTLNTGIDKIRSDMLENLNNVKNTYVVALEDLNKKSKGANAEISTIPAKEKRLLEITRQQKILEELFSFLLQKKLETSISSASTISNIRVLEPAMASKVPVSPNRKGLYTLALMLGVLIPGAIVFLKEYLNDKVKTREDVEKLTTTPLVGEVSHADEGGALVVKKNNRQYIAEQFRIIRSNLQYLLPKVEKPVILVTSSFSGEGKSFVATNLGAVLAISGKRTVVLEFDIRKPKIMEGLGLSERKGITNFIVGSLSLSEIVYSVPDQENLFVIPCGPVPPNPAEMLLDEKVDLLFRELRHQFDAVIIDSAPVGLVSDAITLGKHANACMYIVRHNYTYKKQVKLIDELYKTKRFPNLAIIINDINPRAGYGNYYGYGNYGYGSYGYGIESEKSSQRSRMGVLNWLKNVFGSH
jgi:capsular exopolysaccharide synthesis family protein